jgi:hypothetical protein
MEIKTKLMKEDLKKVFCPLPIAIYTTNENKKKLPVTSSPPHSVSGRATKRNRKYFCTRFTQHTANQIREGNKKMTRMDKSLFSYQ